MKRTACYPLSSIVLLSVLCLMISGCRDSSEPPAETAADALPDSLFLAAEPAGIQSISALKSDAKEGDTVVIKAVVGGRQKVFVNSRAVMAVIDAELKNPCTVEDDHCATPWDYCCTPSEQLLSQMASVQIVGSDSRPLAVDLSAVENLKPLTTLVIQGTVAPRPDQASLVINATGIYVASKQE
ncbi:MAG: hypothetical protein ACYTER_05055 [Planctomycetota bacterium]